MGGSSAFEPWVDESLLERTGRSRAEVAEEEAQRWRERLAMFALGMEEARELRAVMAPRVLTPGMVAAKPLNVLSPLEQPGTSWKDDPETARESLSASISLLLRLLGRDADPTRSRDHVVLSVFAERRLKEGLPADVASLLGDVRQPLCWLKGPMTRRDLKRALAAEQESSEGLA